MLRTDIIDLVNRGDVWAFIGSGPSVDSGCPTWGGLVNNVLGTVEADIRDEIAANKPFISSLKSQNFPKCFSLIQKYIGRDKLEELTRSEIKNCGPARDLSRLITDWPFAGYITTNYDTILESALRDAGRMGWSSVGNVGDEIRKVSGDASRVVWHVHGSADLGNDKSKLILTENDYDEVYLNDSPILRQLRGLLAHRRVVFIGFGFKDPEVNRMLVQVGQLCSPARPAYGFLSDIDGSENAEARKELLERFNIDVIPYKRRNGSHKELLDTLTVHGAMVLRRSLRFDQPLRQVPSYDPEATGLLIYNELILKGTAIISEDTLSSLLRARLLSTLKYQGKRTLSELLQELSERTRVITGRTEVSDKEIVGVIEKLAEAKLIKVDVGADSTQTIQLTGEGYSFVADQAAKAERLADQFLGSLNARANEQFPTDNVAASKVANAAEAFLKECVERRSLGIAMARSAWRPEQQDYHMVALLQALPSFMAQLSTPEEAIALTRLVQGVLRRPSNAEATYIGLALQSRFGVHILGYDADTFRARARELSETVFLLDATTLIPLLARSSPGNAPSILLVEGLKSVGSHLATTSLLTEEVAEHARYAIRRAGSGLAYVNVDLLKAATGREGERLNAFISGFLEEIGKGITPPDFNKYISAICESCKKGRTLQDIDIQAALLKQGVIAPSFGQWEGI